MTNNKYERIIDKINEVVKQIGFQRFVEQNEDEKEFLYKLKNEFEKMMYELEIKGEA